ncbi:MAG TPA: hypothetical protein VK119_02505 [Bacillota bacterium]|nr:hypothetical protein [Bacillota bacterium]
MMVSDTPIEMIYLTMLIASGILIIVYLLFGDILEGIGETVNFLNPILILAFITFFSASGFILEKVTTINRPVIIAISVLIALILDTLLNVFVLVPMSTAEESLTYTEDSLRGRVGKIIVPIPEGGFGEIVIRSKSGLISKPAAHYDTGMIDAGKRVLVIDNQQGVLLVVPYEDDT